MCRHLELPFEEKMLEEDADNSSFDEQGGGIYTSSVGRWKESLTKEEALIAQMIAKKDLRRLEYSIEEFSANTIKVAGYFLSSPFAALRAFKANKGRLGPFVPYLLKRVASLAGRNKD